MLMIGGFDVVALFVWLLGLCVGSFLNVVVYRLPLALSISKPRWSFCPACKTTLLWSDNLPLIGWLRLCGRCRTCRAPISAQYPLVEAATGLAFVLTYHLLFAAQMRVGLDDLALPGDAPLLLAWLILAAALIACSVLDIASYYVDTRITDVALAAGIVLHALWPRAAFHSAQVATASGAAAFAALIVSGLMLWLFNGSGADEEDDAADSDATQAGSGDRGDATVPADDPRPGRYAAILLVFAVAAALLMVESVWSKAAIVVGLSVPVIAAFVLLCAAMILAGAQERDADHEIHAEIEVERPAARRVALGELAWLGPAAAAAVLAFLLVAYVPAAGFGWRWIVGWSPVGGFAPFGGAAYAIHGAIVAALAGWIIRIGFTLALGKEAFGTGDIYILAAAGAVAGWDLALLGFLLAFAIALAAWIVSYLLKRNVMLPFGPPLAMGMLLALALNEPGHRLASYYRNTIAFLWEHQPRMILLLAGVLVVVSVAAIGLAKLVRRLLEPAQGEQG